MTWFDWLIAESPHYDLVCLTGDILNLGDLSSEVDREVDVAIARLAEIQTPLALCSGNHDLHYPSGQDRAQWMQTLRRKNVWMDRDAFCFRNYRFRCIGWCEPVPRSTKDDFWLMHAPPFGAKTSMVVGGISHGDEEARDVCLAGDGPRFALGGHIHNPIGTWGVLNETVTLNPGRGNHPEVPSHLMIDMRTQRVVHQRAMCSGITATTFNFAP